MSDKDTVTTNDSSTNRIIAFPFAFQANMNSGVNIRKEKALETYLKNICVAAISAKHYNPDCFVAFVTSLDSKDIPDFTTQLLQGHGVEIIHIPFDRFCFEPDYPWSLAFYKLCALSHLIEKGFDSICYLDADVFIQGSFDPIWKECRQNLLLYDINHGLQTENYRQICSEFAAFSGWKEPEYITHYGGEFFCADLPRAREFHAIAEKIYKEMLSQHFRTTKGDEFIVSLSANAMKGSVKNAGAYIFRFWSGVRFHLVSTCYLYNAVTVLHLPAEKERGMTRLYNRFISKGRFPANETVWRVCRLSRQPILDRTARVVLKMIKGQD